MRRISTYGLTALKDETLKKRSQSVSLSKCGREDSGIFETHQSWAQSLWSISGIFSGRKPHWEKVSTVEQLLCCTVFISSLLPAFLRLVSQPITSVQTGFKWLELGIKVGSSIDHFQLLLYQCREDLNTMRAEAAGVIGNWEIMSWGH